MGQPQQEIRQAAVEAFQQSLEQLQQALESTQETSKPLQSTGIGSGEASPTHPITFDLSIWEEAIADIEQFIQQRQAEQE